MTFFSSSNRQNSLHFDIFYWRKLVEFRFFQHCCDHLMESEGTVDTDCSSADQQLLHLTEVMEKPVSQGHWELESGTCWFCLLSIVAPKHRQAASVLHPIPSSQCIFCWHYLHVHLLHDYLSLSFIPTFATPAESLISSPALRLLYQPGLIFPSVSLFFRKLRCWQQDPHFSLNKTPPLQMLRGQKKR